MIPFNIAIIINSKEESIIVQKYLYEQGYFWSSGEKITPITPQFVNFYRFIIIIRDGILTYSTDTERRIRKELPDCHIVSATKYLRIHKLMKINEYKNEKRL